MVWVGKGGDLRGKGGIFLWGKKDSVRKNEFCERKKKRFERKKRVCEGKRGVF